MEDQPTTRVHASVTLRWSATAGRDVVVEAGPAVAEASGSPVYVRVENGPAGRSFAQTDTYVLTIGAACGFVGDMLAERPYGGLLGFVVGCGWAIWRARQD